MRFMRSCMRWNKRGITTMAVILCIHITILLTLTLKADKFTDEWLDKFVDLCSSTVTKSTCQCVADQIELSYIGMDLYRFIDRADAKKFTKDDEKIIEQITKVCKPTR